MIHDSARATDLAMRVTHNAVRAVDADDRSDRYIIQNNCATQRAPLEGSRAPQECARACYPTSQCQTPLNDAPATRADSSTSEDVLYVLPDDTETQILEVAPALE